MFYLINFTEFLKKYMLSLNMIPTTQTSFKQIGPIWAQEHIGKPLLVTSVL